MSEYERIVRELLRGRACVEGVAADPAEAYRILGADLERLMCCGACGSSPEDHGGFLHGYDPTRP